MKSYVTLYVPSRYVKVKVEASHAFARIAGGVTITRAKGVWEANADQPLVHDHIDLLKSFVGGDPFISAKNLTYRPCLR